MPRPVSSLFYSRGRDKNIPTLEGVLEELRQALRDVCKVYGIEDLSRLQYHTIAVGTSETRKNGRTYRRIQLKGFNEKSKTIASWREEDTPRDLYRLVNLYRATKYLSKACDYLYGV